MLDARLASLFENAQTSLEFCRFRHIFLHYQYAPASASHPGPGSHAAPELA